MALSIGLSFYWRSILEASSPFLKSFGKNTFI
uniref:Uncharacterized protein n=1 Tax=Anguilla anguilla TaxID=7936 RepID=A0A0E9VP19_ANGAN